MVNSFAVCCAERPRRRTDKSRDKFPPFHGAVDWHSGRPPVSACLQAGWGFFVYQIKRFGSPVFEMARAIHALA